MRKRALTTYIAPDCHNPLELSTLERELVEIPANCPHLLSSSSLIKQKQPPRPAGGCFYSASTL